MLSERKPPASAEVLAAGRGDKLVRPKLLGLYRIIINSGRGTTEIRLVAKLFGVRSFLSKPRRPNRNHSQKDGLLPSIVYFHLS
jgi:hypothetical protein